MKRFCASVGMFALLAIATFPFFLSFSALAGTPASQPLGANLYTTFWPNSGNTAIEWITCGSTQETEGCYRSGTMSPFSKVCAILENGPKVTDNEMTREIYVLDSGSGTAADVTLDVFKQIDVVTTSDDTTTIELAKSVVLPVAGGGKAKCSMAADPQFLFVGTNVSATAVRVAKKDLSTFSYGAFSPPIPVTEITADEQGYVTINYADPTGTDKGFIVIGPDGSTLGDGGGNEYFLNSRNGYRP